MPSANSIDRILFLGNDIIFAKALAKKINSIGYSHVKLTTSNSEFTMEMLTSEYHLAIIDLNKNSLSLVMKLNLQKVIPFIILSKIDDDEHIDEATRLGVSAYLAKPPSKSQLKISIRRALGNPTYKWLSLGSKNIRFQKGNIYCIVANGHLSNIYLTNQKKINVSMSITQLIKYLNYAPLVQVHRSYTINIDKVEAFSNTTIFLPFNIKHHGIFNEPNCIPISKTKAKDVIQLLKSRYNPK